MKEALYILGDLIHQLQKERGYLVAYLSSQSSLFTKQLQTQFSDSDRVIQVFREALERWDKNSDLTSFDLSHILILPNML